MEVSNEFEAHKLGSVLKAARCSQNLTREQLSKKAGVGYRHLMGIENKNKTPGFGVLFRLIRALGISADAVYYPEKESGISEMEQLVHMIYLCGNKEIRAVTALLNELLDGDDKA